METHPLLSSVSFFCPAYNEEENLPTLIPRARAFLKEITPVFEIIIIDDGSKDRTFEIAQDFANKFPEVRVIRHSPNWGYGATVREGFKAARYEYVTYTDGDNQYDVYDLLPALSLLEGADIVSGYVRRKAVTWRRKLQSFIFNAFIAVLFGVRIRDINCSMKIYKRKVLDTTPIHSRSAFIDAEMLIRAKRAGFTIRQFPVNHYERAGGVASGSSLGIIVPTFLDMIKFRLGLL